MNFLAHAYLSYEKPAILVGNMISDFVKGSQKAGFSPAIQNGIVLHRAIDSFTDLHPATAEAKSFFRPHYRLYSGPITDVLYDHFLAMDESIFPDGSLLRFTSGVYATLEAETVHLPPRFLPVLTYMKAENWLYHYRTTDGIRQSLRGLIRRASYITDSATAFDLFLTHYNALRDCYAAFFPDVKQMAKQMVDELAPEF